MRKFIGYSESPIDLEENSLYWALYADTCFTKHASLDKKSIKGFINKGVRIESLRKRLMQYGITAYEIKDQK